MQVTTSELKVALKTASNGLASKAIIEQSDCFIFTDEKITTFSSEVAVQVPFKADFEAAIPAEPLLAFVNRCSDKEIDMIVEEGKLKLKGKRTRVAIPIKAEIVLPFRDKITPPDKGISIPDSHAFSRALSYVEFTISTDTQFPELTCVHINSDKKGTFCESSDKYRITRKYFSTDRIFEKDIFIPHVAVKVLKGETVESIGFNNGWLYFNLPGGILFACYTIEVESFTDYDSEEFVNSLGKKVSGLILPEKITAIMERASIFSKTEIANDQKVTLTLKENKLVITSEGPWGDFRESTSIDWDRSEFSFVVHPNHFMDMIRLSKELILYPGDVKVVGKGSWHYVRMQEDVSANEE